MTQRIAFDDLTVGTKALLLGKRADVGQRAQRELASIATGAIVVTDAPEGVTLPGATSAKTTKWKKTTVDETTIEEPDDDQDDDQDDDDDDSEEDDEDEGEARAAVSALLATSSKRTGISAQIEAIANRAGLTDDARKAFIAQAVRDQATARPAKASAPVQPSMEIKMGADDMAEPKPAKARAAVAHRSPSLDAPPPIVGGPWKDRP